MRMCDCESQLIFLIDGWIVYQCGGQIFVCDFDQGFESQFFYYVSVDDFWVEWKKKFVKFDYFCDQQSCFFDWICEVEVCIDCESECQLECCIVDFMQVLLMVYFGKGCNVCFQFFVFIVQYFFVVSNMLGCGDG